MPPGLMFVVVPFVIALGALGVYLSHKQAEQRRKCLMLVADRLGWHFDPREDNGWEHRYGQFSCFREGRSRKAFNVMQGTLTLDDLAVNCAAGDYTYVTGSGKSRRTHHFSFLLLPIPYRPIHDVALRPECAFDGLSAFLGFDDIDFESAEFSRRYHVQGSNKRFAYDLIDARMIEFLMSRAARTFEITRGVLCVRSSGCRWEPADFRSEIDWCLALVDHWPRSLRGLGI